jgi:hypothetical protein
MDDPLIGIQHSSRHQEPPLPVAQNDRGGYLDKYAHDDDLVKAGRECEVVIKTQPTSKLTPAQFSDPPQIRFEDLNSNPQMLMSPVRGARGRLCWSTSHSKNG